jgi:hypothetical protein
MLTFYSRNGRAIAYLDDDEESIFLINGHAAAWLKDNNIYSYSGKYLGWIENGWIYDRSGRCAFFTDNAVGGPAKPARSATPARGARSAQPAKGAREARPARPAKSLSWSEYSNDAYFSR